MIIGNGIGTDFWCDNWSTLGSLILRVQEQPQNFPKLRDVYSNGRWEFSLCPELSEQLSIELSSLQISFCDKQDLLVWMPSSSGKFTVKSAWSTVRQSEQQNLTTTLI